VTTAWQAVVAALRPAVSEEAWARVFLVVALFLRLRRFAQDGTAMSAAVAVSTLWFAFLHGPANPVAAVLLAVIYVLP
jgi:membrane protease YdiL (CAAX protease family)